MNYILVIFSLTSLIRSFQTSESMVLFDVVLSEAGKKRTILTLMWRRILKIMVSKQPIEVRLCEFWTGVEIKTAIIN